MWPFRSRKLPVRFNNEDSHNLAKQGYSSGEEINDDVLHALARQAPVKLFVDALLRDLMERSDVERVLRASEPLLLPRDCSTDDSGEAATSGRLSFEEVANYLKLMACLDQSKCQQLKEGTICLSTGEEDVFIHMFFEDTGDDCTVRLRREQG